MTNETLTPNVPEMIRTTGENTAGFMKQVADHVDKLETEVAQLTARIKEMEADRDNSN